MSKFEKQKQPCCICKGHKANEPLKLEMILVSYIKHRISLTVLIVADF